VFRGLYHFALTRMLSPVCDLLSTVWPLRPTEMAWRYGMLGLTAGYLQTPILGLVLGMAVAYWDGEPGILRFGSILSLAGTVVLLIAMATFALDVVGMRAVRPDEARAGILVGGVLQQFKYLGAALVLACLGVGGLVSAKLMLRVAPPREGTPVGVLKRDV
jgi:hypothetical protein